MARTNSSRSNDMPKKKKKTPSDNSFSKTYFGLLALLGLLLICLIYKYDGTVEANASTNYRVYASYFSSLWR
jgi:hypothetical protein